MVRRPSPTPQQIARSYRQLYKGLLQAVQYSAPARFIARDKIRRAFRKSETSDYDQLRIDRTIEFLSIAARENGIEHRILRNLLHVGYWEKMKTTAQVKMEIETRPMAPFYETVDELNKSVGLCLR